MSEKAVTLIRQGYDEFTESDVIFGTTVDYLSPDYIYFDVRQGINERASVALTVDDAREVAEFILNMTKETK